MKVMSLIFYPTIQLLMHILSFKIPASIVPEKPLPQMVNGNLLNRRKKQVDNSKIRAMRLSLSPTIQSLIFMLIPTLKSLVFTIPEQTDTNLSYKDRNMDK